MDDKQNHSSGGGGFAWGLVLGVAVGALVSTKKGRQIIKDLAEYGLDYVEGAINFEDFSSVLNMDEEEEEMMEGELEEEKVKEEMEKMEEKEDEKPETSKKKRLFRGIRKK